MTKKRDVEPSRKTSKYSMALKNQGKGTDQQINIELNELKAFLNQHNLVARSVSYYHIKRFIDIFFSAIALLILFPIYLALAVVVRCTSSGPIFYKSYRVGLCGKPILFVKYRTMRIDADKMLEDLQKANEKDGPIFKMKRDPRITRIGSFLRKYSLDELPQFLSVLVGDMSMVGPRPPIPKEVICYDETSLKRLTIKPGITCYWQIMGRSNLSFEEWVRLDLKYLDEMSVWTDFQIMFKTVPAVLSTRGAY